MRKRIKYALTFISGVTVGFGTCGIKVLSYAAKKGYLKDIVREVLHRKVDSIFSDYEYYCKDYPCKTDAEEVLKHIQDTVDICWYVSLAEVREYTLDENIYSMYNQYQSTLYGWFDASKFAVVRTRNGYELRIPKPTRLG